MSDDERKSLTMRQHEVAVLLAKGQTNSEIAEALGISVKTIDTHRQFVMKRLRLRNNVELAHHAIKAGWIQVND